MDYAAFIMYTLIEDLYATIIEDLYGTIILILSILLLVPLDSLKSIAKVYTSDIFLCVYTPQASLASAAPRHYVKVNVINYFPVLFHHGKQVKAKR